MKKNTYTKGYSLVEVLVAVAILMFSIVGPMSIAAKSLQSAQYARQQNTAFFLAQEGISIVNTIRNNSGLDTYTGATTDPWAWRSDSSLSSCFTASGCNIDFRDGTLLNNVVSCATPANCVLLFNESAPRAVYQLQSGTASPFTRTILLTAVGSDEVLVTSKVQWGSTLLGGTQTVSLNTSLFNIYK